MCLLFALIKQTHYVARKRETNINFSLSKYELIVYIELNKALIKNNRSQ